MNVAERLNSGCWHTLIIYASDDQQINDDELRSLMFR